MKRSRVGPSAVLVGLATPERCNDASKMAFTFLLPPFSIDRTSVSFPAAKTVDTRDKVIRNVPDELL
jgi:hypothetical protein